MNLFRLLMSFGHLGPVFLTHFSEKVELSGALQPLAAVDGDDLTVDVAALVGKKVDGQIS